MCEYRHVRTVLFSCQFDQIKAFPEAVFPGVVAVLNLEHFFDNLQVVGDVEGVAGVFVAEEIIEIVEPGPGDRRQAQRAGFVGGQKQAVAGVRARRFRQFIERLKGGNLAVIKRLGGSLRTFLRRRVLAVFDPQQISVATLQST